MVKFSMTTEAAPTIPWTWPPDTTAWTAASVIARLLAFTGLGERAQISSIVSRSPLRQLRGDQRGQLRLPPVYRFRDFTNFQEGPLGVSNCRGRWSSVG